MNIEKSIGIWIRVSTEDQAQGESPEHHERRARYYAESKGWHIHTIYHLEGVSGKAVMDHPETQRMIADIKNGTISGIIFSKLARLARNTKELLDFAELFRKHHADLVSLQESIDTSSPAGRLFYTMIAAMAQWEREEISERVAASVPVRAKLGKPLGGQAPFGYQWVDQELIPHPKEAPVRNLLHELFKEYKRKRTVARILNERGYRTRNGSNFSGTTVGRLLEDPTVMGKRRANYTKSLGEGKHWELKPESEWVYVDVEPIISEELWNECTAILEEQKKNQKPITKRGTHLFTGHIFCTCGGKMYVPSRSPKYICQTCRNKIGEEDLEDIFREQLHEFIISPDEIAEYLKNSDKSLKEKEELYTHLIQEKNSIQKEMNSLIQLHQSGELPQKGFARHYQPLEDRLEQIENQLPELQGEIDFLKIYYLSSDEIIHEAQTLYDQWEVLSDNEKRLIVENTVDTITIGDTDISINLNYLPSSLELMTERQHNLMDSLLRQA
ncbi:MAG: recombinase family protein [Melioribacteraceae bacterium]|nr:recombinase family protein [Melioribacteraceae bacterium]